MPDDLDALLAEVPGDEETPATPAPEASTESTPVKFAELDGVVPDAPDVDEEFRGKAIAEVLRVAKQHRDEAKRGYTASQQLNEAQARQRVAEAALEFFQRQPQQQQAPQQPHETNDEYLQRLAAQPRSVIHSEVDERVAPLQQRMQQNETLLTQTLGELAQTEARESLGINRQTWQQIRGPVATFMAYQQWPVQDPRAWAAAAKMYVENAVQTAQQFIQPPPQQAPPVEVPKPGAPPNGAARSQVRQAAAPKVKSHYRKAVDDTSDAFGLDDKSKADFESFVAERGTE